MQCTLNFDIKKLNHFTYLLIWDIDAWQSVNFKRMHTHIHTHTHTRTHSNLHILTRSHINTQTHAQTHPHALFPSHTHTRIYIYIYIIGCSLVHVKKFHKTFFHIYMHSIICIYVFYIYIYIYIYIVHTCIYIYMCVCVCVHIIKTLQECLWEYIYIYVCVCVCVCGHVVMTVLLYIHRPTDTHTPIYIYIYIWSGLLSKQNMQWPIVFPSKISPFLPLFRKSGIVKASRACLCISLYVQLICSGRRATSALENVFLREQRTFGFFYKHLIYIISSYLHTHTHTHTYIYIHIYIYICIS